MEYFESPWQRSTGGCQHTSAHWIKKYKKIEHIIRGKTWAKITEEQMRWIGLFVISLGLLIGTPVVFISIIWLQTFFFLQEYWNVSLFSLFVFIILFIVLQETGFWFIFHHVPTGPSEGLYSPGHTEHTPMGHFTNNRAHSNYRVSFRVCKWQIVFVYKCLTRPTSEYQQVFQSKGKTFIVMYKLLQTQWHWI